MSCRLLGFYAKSRKFVEDLLDALIKASRYDHIAAKVIGSFDKHDDGWGCVLALKNDDYWRVLFYKSVKPIWEEDLSFLKSSLNFKYVAGLIHTRKASRNTPIDTFSAHPFSVVTADGSTLYVIQNGGIKKKESWEVICEEYDFEPDDVSDTFIYTLMLAKYYRQRSGAPPERLAKTLRKLHSFLEVEDLAGRCVNTFILQYSPGDRVSLGVVVAYYNEKYVDYYKVYKVTSNENELAFVSSTVAEVLATKGYTPELVENRKVLVYVFEEEELKEIEYNLE
ncbi:MAG: hypothetical protein DRN04_05435 [Thermoprotei archaeon]|nr:MAG: hypothetical protein DRN04_05435 [Thermoprotei archaeon]